MFASKEQILCSIAPVYTENIESFLLLLYCDTQFYCIFTLITLNWLKD